MKRQKKNAGYINGELLNLILTKMKPERNTPEWHKLQIALDTIKHPMKAVFLGGPTLGEAIETAKQYGYKF
jgi:hypothetical protein